MAEKKKKKSATEGDGTQAKEHKPNWREVYASPEDIKTFLGGRLYLRHNVITGRVECRLPFEVESIRSPRDHPFNYAGIYAQAYALYQDGFRRVKYQGVRGYIVVCRKPDEMQMEQRKMAREASPDEWTEDSSGQCF